MKNVIQIKIEKYWLYLMIWLLICPNIKWKILIVFDDMIADMLGNKKLIPIVTEVLNVSLVFIIQSYLSAPKTLD